MGLMKLWMEGWVDLFNHQVVTEGLARYCYRPWGKIDEQDGKEPEGAYVLDMV